MKKLFAPLGLALLAATLPAAAQTPAPAPAPAAAPAPAPVPGGGAQPMTAQGAAKHMTAGQVIDRMLASLGLTPEQQEQTAAMRQKFETATESLRADVRALIVELRSLRGTQGSDPKLYETKRAELTEAQGKLRAEFDKLYGEVSTVLDPAQKAKLDQLRASLGDGLAPNTTLPSPAGQKSAPAPGATGTPGRAAAASTGAPWA